MDCEMRAAAIDRIRNGLLFSGNFDFNIGHCLIGDINLYLQHFFSWQALNHFNLMLLSCMTQPAHLDSEKLDIFDGSVFPIISAVFVWLVLL